MDPDHSEHRDHSEHHDHLDPLTHVAQTDAPDYLADARAEAGRAVRDIGHALVGHQAPVELIDRITSVLDDLTAELEVHPSRSRSEERPSGDWGPPPADGETMTSYDERPISGRSSPWGLDLAIVRDGDEAVARLTLRAAHEGAPGRSHGGVVAALFDDVYGFVLTMFSQPAFTGQLGVRYEAGTPIGRPLECRVRQERREGRKLFMTGELIDTTLGTIVARSTATFIAIEADEFGVGTAG
jgi:acyl-coenzyme A thioesterase PaaI-like protein